MDNKVAILLGSDSDLKYVENSNDINLSHLESLITNKTAAIEFVIAQFITEKNVLKLEEVVSIICLVTTVKVVNYYLINCECRYKVHLL